MSAESEGQRETLERLKRIWTFNGYVLGMKIAEAILPFDQNERRKELVDYLEGVACGEIVLHESGADVRRRLPDAEDVEEILRDNADADRQAASFVLDRLLEL